MNLQQTLEQVKNSPSSLFSKDDVIRIVSGIEVTKGTSMTIEQIESIAEDIANRIDRNRDSIFEIESVTVSAGSYGNSIDDVSTAIDSDDIQDIVTEILQEYVTPAEDDSTGTENNSPDNQAVSN